jgi:intracellular multiplication protein IcmX
MKLFVRLLLSCLLFVVTAIAFASAGAPNPSAQGTENNEGNSELPTYLLNLGGYLGYDLRTSPAEGRGGPGAQQSTEISRTFIDLPAMRVLANYLFNSYLGALIVNTAAQGATQFVPLNSPVLTAINAFANYTFTTQSNAAQPNEQQLFISSLIDQPPYQADPVSQSVMNILTTPDYTYCLNKEGTDVGTCTYKTGTLNSNDVMIKVIGNLPGPEDFFKYDPQVQPLLSQLNINSLLSPLLYTTTSPATGTTTTGATATPKMGLEAHSQAEQAVNFIRYTLGAMMPLRLPSRSEYEALYVKSVNIDKNYSDLEQWRAQAVLADYFGSLRSYAAQSSVAASNLYYMLSRRLPQSQGTSGATQQQTSQALSEFTMATRRLYNPDQSENTQWLAQINQASAATVQKEIAGLLAEINYQLYLNHQQQERILLTNTVLLLQIARLSPPPSLSRSTTTLQGTAAAAAIPAAK